MFLQSKHGAVGVAVRAGFDEIVKGAVRNADDVIGDETCAFRRAVLQVFDETFPLQHRPAIEAVGRQLREDRPEIDLPVALVRKRPARLDQG